MTATVRPSSGGMGDTVGTSLVIELEGFSGPLDLLLHLLREQQIEISEIPIARVADQFLAAIHDLRLNQAADYLEMASRLVRLKVQMLLPRPRGDEDWEDPRAELVRRLLEYQQTKEVALWVGRSIDRRALQHPRGYLPSIPELPAPTPELDLLELLEAVGSVIAGILHPVLHSVVARPLDIEGATLRLETLLAGRDEISWADAVGPNPTVVALLSTLLALLELARNGFLRVAQQIPFTPPVIRRDSTLPTD